MKRMSVIKMFLLLTVGLTFFFGCKKNSSEEDPESSAVYEPVQVSGNIVAPQGMNIDYTSLVVNGGAITTTSPGGSGDFTINLNKNATQLVSAVQPDGTPVLLNIIVTPQSNDNIELDAHSTARSLIFLNPAAVVSDPALSNTVMGLIDGLPETTTLATLIETKLKTNPDILFQDDPAICSAIEAAVTKLLQKIDDLSDNGFLNKPLQIDRLRELKHLSGQGGSATPSAPAVSGDLTITPSGEQSGMTVSATKKSDNIYEIQVTNSKKRYVNAFLDDPTVGNIGSAFLPSRKSLLDWDPLAPSTEKISSVLDISAHPTTVLYAYSLGALKHGDLIIAPSYITRTIKPIIFTGVYDFFFPLLDVISGVKGYGNAAPGTDPTGVASFIITKMNGDASLLGQMTTNLETGDFSGALTTAVKGALQVVIQNPTLVLQYVKGRVVGSVLFQVLAPAAVAPLRIALIGLSGMDVLTAAYGFATTAWLEKWTLSSGEGYDGTWAGTFYYTARIPQESGPPTIVNESITVSITLESKVAIPGIPQVLTVTSATCSDPTFGATTPVIPQAPLSLAILPASFGSSSLLGQGINIIFPNGSELSTANSTDGAFTVNAVGQVLASTALVATDAFLASGTVDDSNLPGSGPGGYAYNWCTFTSWSLTKQGN